MRQLPFAIVVSVVLSFRPSPAQTKACTWPELKPSPLNLNFSQGSVDRHPRIGDSVRNGSCHRTFPRTRP